MADLKISQTDLARMIGITPAAVHQILSGKTKRTSYLSRIARSLLVDERWISGETDEKDADMQANFDRLYPLPLYSVKSMICADSREVTIDSKIMPFDPERHPDFLLVTDLGDAMAPALFSTDIVLVDSSFKELSSQPNVWLFHLVDQPFQVRRLQKIKDQVEVSADGPAEARFRVEADQVHVVGLVTWYGRNLI